MKVRYLISNSGNIVAAGPVKNLDIVLVATPLMSTLTMAPAPALLKAVLKKQGYEALALDLNIQLKLDTENCPTVYDELSKYFQMDLRYIRIRYGIANHLDKEKYLELLTPKTEKVYRNLIEKYAQKIIGYNSTYIGISFFSSNSIIFSLDLMAELRKQGYKRKIIIGGMGINEYNIANLAKQYNFCDHIIWGEGEVALCELLRGNLSYPGIDNPNFKQLSDLSDIPPADYSDYFCENRALPPQTLSITGSRGCIRRCTFCDVPSLWPKFRTRKGASLAQEVLHYFQEHSVQNFSFTDSLVNGSTFNFIDFCKNIILYKEEGLLPSSTHFSGQFICQSKVKFPEENYILMNRSGFNKIFIGVESGSNNVLASMRKKFLIKDLDFMIKSLSNNNIKAELLFIIGYPSETIEDFNETIELLKRYKKFSDNGTIVAVTLGKTLGILSKTHLAENMEQYGIIYDKLGNWYSTKNESLNMQERLRRRMIAQEVCDELGYRTRWPRDNFNLFNSVLDMYDKFDT